MTRFVRSSILAAAGLAIAGVAFAQNNDPAAAAVNVRQAHMQLYAANLGVLGGMAQGRMEYDAEAAQAAADNLAALASIDQRFYWLSGTHAGAIEDTRALEAIWTDRAGFDAEIAGLAEAAAGMQAAAGQGLDSLRGALGPVGASCGSCHEAYRQSNN